MPQISELLGVLGRYWVLEEKRRIVAETYAVGSSVSLVARRHDVNANMLFTWRREIRAAAGDGEGAVRFLPATITDRTPGPALPSSSAAAGRMEIVLASGDRVIIGAAVEEAALLRMVMVRRLGHRTLGGNLVLRERIFELLEPHARRAFFALADIAEKRRMHAVGRKAKE